MVRDTADTHQEGGAGDGEGLLVEVGAAEEQPHIAGMLRPVEP